MEKSKQIKYAELILPLALPGTFSYIIPPDLVDQVEPGKRVEVEFGKRKHYSALVKSIHEDTQWSKPKSILAVIDEFPIVNTHQLEFWDWLSQYYLCYPGEIMTAALPSGFRLQSEMRLGLLKLAETIEEPIEDDEYLILEALELREELSVLEVQQLLQKNSVLKLINSLLDKKWIFSYEKLEEGRNVQKVAWIRLNDNLRADESKLNASLDKVQHSSRQSRSLVYYLQNKQNYSWIKRKELQKLSETSSDVTEALIKKNIYEELVLDKHEYPNESDSLKPVLLNNLQKEALLQIGSGFDKSLPVLLHGVTGSGKTMIYIELIIKCLNEGKQVLYLVPEIALTTQLVYRLKDHLGMHLLEYHSDLSAQAKAAVWNAAGKLNRVFIGARSALFLPFTNLGLIIVDEEHDPSYKQNDPAPRYQARDCAVVMAGIHRCDLILGSATPSVESYYNARNEKYAYVELKERFGESPLPEIFTISMKEEFQFGKVAGHFSSQLIDAIQSEFEKDKQVIIFRNRRGYSPLLQCSNCNWEAQCNNCDLHMTLHKYQNRLRCHLCGNHKPIPERCPDCGQFTLRQLGFGTEQIEEELQEQFSDKVIKRLDLDVARSRKIQQSIIEEFQERETNILVGTQMVTKGLDFDHVGLVGILQADQILFYPDFRSQERAFQLFTQVAGRAGRRKDKGKVYIQGFNVHHPVIQCVIEHNSNKFYESELSERKKFSYPPFVRLIKIQLLHLKIETVEAAATELVRHLKSLFGKRILGPSEPQVSKVKGSHVRDILVKIERSKQQMDRIKQELQKKSQLMKSSNEFRSVRIHIDVDP